MRVTVVLEFRFYRTPDGLYWTTSAFARPFWDRYLGVFEQVRVVARSCPVEEPPPTAVRSDGENVEFCPVPYYVGPGQFLQHAPQVYGMMKRAIADDDAVIMRIGSLIALFAEPSLRRRQHPYGVEVVGDPYEVYAPGVVQHPLRPLFRWWFTRVQQRQCWHAAAAAYVTRNALQKRYPCKALQASISDVEISESSILETPRVFDAGGLERTAAAYADGTRGRAPASPRSRLILVGSLEQYYKAPDVIIAALARLVKAECNLELVIVGDGKYRNALQQLAQDLGVGDRVFFRGMLPAGQAVRDELDAADLFVLPSRTEGLPRAMIEAMARGLPCIGSTVGGIPELLPTEDMVPPGDVDALADKLVEVLRNPERMARMSARGVATAKEYLDDVLRARRIAFYRYVREATQAWLHSRDG